MPTPCPFVPSLYLFRIALQALFIGAKTPMSRGWRRWVVFGRRLLGARYSCCCPSDQLQDDVGVMTVQEQQDWCSFSEVCNSRQKHLCEPGRKVCTIHPARVIYPVYGCCKATLHPFLVQVLSFVQRAEWWKLFSCGTTCTWYLCTQAALKLRQTQNAVSSQFQRQLLWHQRGSGMHLTALPLLCQTTYAQFFTLLLLLLVY